MEELSWQDFLDKLVHQQNETDIKDFCCCLSDHEKVLFCLQRPQINEHLEKWLNNNPPVPKGKKLDIYSRSKADGNQAYIKKSNHKAIQLYNNALRHATQGLDSALIFGNRSAVLFSENRFQECISDIDAALNHNFPSDKADKLYKRKSDALVKLKRHKEARSCLESALVTLKDAGNTEKLSELLDSLNELEVSIDINGSDDKVRTELHGGQNQSITNASSFLTKCFDKDRGRYIVANQDIPKGSVVISESPYAAVLLEPWYLTHCQHCFQKVKIHFPCHSCVEVSYCSEECRRVSLERYHHFECGKLDLLEKLGISRLALRIILITPVNVLQLHCIVKHNEDMPHSSNDLNSGCDSSGIYNVDYASVYHLVTNSDSMLAEDTFQYTCAAAILLKCLENDPQNNHSKPLERHFVGGFLLRHIQQLVCNAHAITALDVSPVEHQQGVVEESQVRIATAIYPTTSLLNHSCEPSIVNTFQKDRLIVKLSRDVKKGDEIYNCYGPHYRRMAFEERQRILRQQYFFNCKCEYCSKGASSVIQYNCFSCQHCQGGLSTNGRCSTCGKGYQDRIKYCSGLQQQCDDVFQDALELIAPTNNNKIDNRNVKAALKLLNRCLESRSLILYKHHKDLGETNDAIGRCHALLGDFESSVTHVAQSITIVELHFGKDSLEVTHELLKLSDVYMKWIQLLVDTRNKVKIKATLETFGIPSMERALKLVQLNKKTEDEDIKLIKERLDSLKKLKFICQS